MKLKSYLRGIGIGILVASAVFLVSGMSDRNGGMSDEQIIERAKELGMVEGNKTLVDAGSEKEDTEEAIVTPDIEVVEEVAKISDVETDDVSVEPEETVAEAEEPEVEEESQPTPEPTIAPTPTPTPEVVAPIEEEKAVTSDDDYVIVVVNPGDGSDKVAMRVYEAGLVSDAHEFDVFLMNNGYDRSISIGNHKISKNATKDEIGRNLVSSTE